MYSFASISRRRSGRSPRPSAILDRAARSCIESLESRRMLSVAPEDVTAAWRTDGKVSLTWDAGSDAAQAYQVEVKNTDTSENFHLVPVFPDPDATSAATNLPGTARSAIVALPGGSGRFDDTYDFRVRGVAGGVAEYGGDTLDALTATLPTVSGVDVSLDEWGEIRFTGSPLVEGRTFEVRMKSGDSPWVDFGTFEKYGADENPKYPTDMFAPHGLGLRWRWTDGAGQVSPWVTRESVADARAENLSAVAVTVEPPGENDLSGGWAYFSFAPDGSAWRWHNTLTWDDRGHWNFNEDALWGGWIDEWTGGDHIAGFADRGYGDWLGVWISEADRRTNPYTFRASAMTVVRAPGTGTTPDAPANLTATPVARTKIGLVWDNQPHNESGFRIERKLSGVSGSTWRKVGQTAADATSFTDTVPDTRPVYEYRVIASNAAGDSAPSNLKTASCRVNVTLSGGGEVTEGSVQSVILTVTRDATGRLLDEKLKVPLSYGGTARFGGAHFDIDPLPRFAVIPAGQTTKQIVVYPRNDSRVEGDETVTARIVPTGQFVTTPSTATVTIHDDDIGPMPPDSGSGTGTGPDAGPDPEDPTLRPPVPPLPPGPVPGFPAAPVTVPLDPAAGDPPPPTSQIDLKIVGSGYWDGTKYIQPNPNEQDYGSTDDGDGETTGYYLRVNSDFDEGNLNTDGSPARDNEPDAAAGDRIVPSLWDVDDVRWSRYGEWWGGDGEVVPFNLGYWSQAEMEGTTWSLNWDASKAKLWVYMPVPAGSPEDTLPELVGLDPNDAQDATLPWRDPWGIGTGVWGWIEAIQESSSLDDLDVTARFTPSEGEAVNDTVRATAMGANLLIDMNNDGTISDADEISKGMPNNPGMTLRVDGADSDNDFVPGFADGYLPGDAARNNSSSTYFVPVRVNLPTWADPHTTFVSFQYNDSPLNQVFKDALNNYDIGGGTLRLWRKDGSAGRDGRDIKDGGDLLSRETEYTAAQLGLQGGLNEGKLFIEAVNVRWKDATRKSLATNVRDAVTMAVRPEGAPLPVVSDVWARGVFDRPDWQYLTYREAGIDVSNFNPSNGYDLINSHSLDSLYTFYGTLYASKPAQFEWAGLAKIAGGSVIRGVRTMESANTFLTGLGISAPHVTWIMEFLAGPVQANLKDMQAELITMAKELFEDLAWQHVAFRAGGIDEIRRLDATNQIDKERADPVAGWEQIAAGGAANVDSGNFILIDREQNVVLERGYTVVRDMPLVEPGVTGLAAGVPIITAEDAIEMGAVLPPFPGALPWSGTTPGTFFNDGTHGAVGYLSDAEPRYRWITYLWRTWKDDWTHAERVAYSATSISQLSL